MGTAAALRDRFLRELRQTLRDPNPDQVHDLRVAIRRFSQLLAIAEPSKETARVRKALKRVMSMAGEVRDCDIALKLTVNANGSARLAARLRELRGEAEARLLKGLARWVATYSPRTWTLPRRVGNRGTPQALRRFFKRGAAAEKSEGKLHPLRIAAKKLRYTLELEQPSSTMLAKIKDLQTRLGDINDLDVTRRIAEREGAAKPVLDELRRKRDKKVAAFRSYWKRTFAGREAKS